MSGPGRWVLCQERGAWCLPALSVGEPWLIRSIPLYNTLPLVFLSRNPSHVITAAHCLPTATRDTIAVMIGDHDINVNEPSQNVRQLSIIPSLLLLFCQAYAVSDIFNHPDYDDVTQANDISVLRLSSMVCCEVSLSPNSSTRLTS